MRDAERKRCNGNSVRMESEEYKRACCFIRKFVAVVRVDLTTIARCLGTSFVSEKSNLVGIVRASGLAMDTQKNSQTVRLVAGYLLAREMIDDLTISPENERITVTRRRGS